MQSLRLNRHSLNSYLTKRQESFENFKTINFHTPGLPKVLKGQKL